MKFDTEYKTIEALRFICSAFVVLRHTAGCLDICGSDGCMITRLVVSIFSHGVTELCVPAFFLISGYLFFARFNKWDWSLYITKLRSRCKTLLSPYLVWNLLALASALMLLIASGHYDKAKTVFADNGGLRMFWDCASVQASENLFGGVIFSASPMDGPLWFMRDLIILVILSPIIYYLVKSLKFSWLVIAIIGYICNVWIPFVGFAPKGALFFSIGAFLQVEKKSLVAPFFIKRNYLYGLSFLLLTGVVLCDFLAPEYHKYLSHTFTIVGTIALICLTAHAIEIHSMGISKVLTNSSFMIFALHGIGVLNLIGSAFGKLPFHSDAWFVFSYFMIAIITVMICIVCDLFLKNNLPWVHGLLTGFRLKRQGRRN